MPPYPVEDVSPEQVVTLPDRLPVANSLQQYFASKATAQDIFAKVQSIVPNATITSGDPDNRYLDNFSGIHVMYMNPSTPRLFQIAGSVEVREPSPSGFGAGPTLTLVVSENAGVLASRWVPGKTSLSVRKVSDSNAELEWV